MWETLTVGKEMGNVGSEMGNVDRGVGSLNLRPTSTTSP